MEEGVSWESAGGSTILFIIQGKDFAIKAGGSDCIALDNFLIMKCRLYQNELIQGEDVCLLDPQQSENEAKEASVLG